MAASVCRITTRSRQSARGIDTTLRHTRPRHRGEQWLGLAVARALPEAGAAGAVTSRDPQRARETAAALGANALPLALDIRDERAVEHTIAAVYDRLGGLDLLVNNAGIGMRA